LYAKSNTIGGLFSCVGEPYSLFAMDAYPHLSTQYCLISEKEKLNSGGVALSLLDYTASLFFQMRIGMSNDLLLPLDEVISPLGHSDFLSPLSVLPLISLKMWERHAIFTHVPLPICAEPWQLFDPLFYLFLLN